MTKIYFVRHAKPNYLVHDDYSRLLTEEGSKDCKRGHTRYVAWSGWAQLCN